MDSRTPALVNQSGLRLTPQRESCTMCYQDNSFTSVVPASTEYQLAVRALTDKIHQRRDAVLHRSHRHQKSSSERKEEHELPRRADPDKSATSAARTQQQQQQCSIAYELTGGVCEVARHPPHRSRSRRSAGRHTKLTVRQPPSCTSDSNHLHNHANRARKSWRSDVSIILPGSRRHTGGSRSTPTIHPCGLRSGGCG